MLSTKGGGTQVVAQEALELGGGCHGESSS